MPNRQQAQMLANRVEKTFRTLHRRFEREQIGAFRLYDRDIPEIRAVIDWYEGHLMMAEYVRTQTTEEWLPAMAEAVAARLQVPPERVHLRRRLTGTQRYERLERTEQRIQVRERTLKFEVNLADYIDTGLFLDHRDTRQRVGKEAAGQDFLNLFGYTGAFTVWAAAGGARSTTTVDLSNTYLTWAHDNLKLNDLDGPQHERVQGDVLNFLGASWRSGRRWSQVVLDPPSRSVSSAVIGGFDIQRDHRELVLATLEVMQPGGVLWFSTNHQRFEPELEMLPVAERQEVTAATIPPDFRNGQVHRCWRMVTPG